MVVVVSEHHDTGCKDADTTIGVFDGLESYSNEVADGKTIGKVSHKESSKGEVEFTVEALQIKLAAGGERSEL